MSGNDWFTFSFSKHRLLLLVVLIVCIGAWYFSGRFYMEKADDAATLLFDKFAVFEFDGIERDDKNHEAVLYEYDESSSSSLVEKRTVAVIPLTFDETEALHKFKNVMAYRGGLFFATEINWNGEWSGIYINPSTVPEVLREYIKDFSNLRAKCGHYWLELVPDYIL